MLSDRKTNACSATATVQPRNDSRSASASGPPPNGPSLGGRLAFIDLARQFPGHPEYPHQSFFTFTPGLVAGAEWHLGERFSAFGRARLNYLFYNVDSNQSLGYAEMSLGVVYAFGL